MVSLRAVRLHHNLPSSASLFISIRTTLKFSDWNGTALANLHVALFVDGTVQNLVTDERGEAQTTLVFTSPGSRKIGVKVPGILVNDAVFVVQVEAMWLIALAAFVVLVYTAKRWLDKKRNIPSRTLRLHLECMTIQVCFDGMLSANFSVSSFRNCFLNSSVSIGF